MPKPVDVVKKEIRDRLKGKSGAKRVRELEAIMQDIPWTVGDYKDIQADLRRQVDNLRGSTGGGGSAFSFRKESPQMLIIGAPNSGKSTLLNAYTAAGARVAEYPFTTTRPVIGIMLYRDVRIHMIEMPPLFEGCFDSDKQPLSVIRITDGLLMMVNEPEEYLMMQFELEKSGIGLEDKHNREGDASKVGIYKRTMVVYRDGEPPTDLISVRYGNDEEIKETVYDTLGIRRVYLLDEKNNKVLPPVVFLQEDFSVRDVMEKSGLRKGKFAKVWGCSAAHDGQRVGLDHGLVDGDSLRVYK